MGHLSTHVLDTFHGKPAEGLKFKLIRKIGDTETVLVDGVTDADGRSNKPLLQGAEFQVGRYEFRFELAAYFRAKGVQLPDPPFLDVVPIAFGIAEPGGKYHVPLLATPWSMSTYRGS
jgi:5-hydroxyisourate hydrolase